MTTPAIRPTSGSDDRQPLLPLSYQPTDATHDAVAEAVSAYEKFTRVAKRGALGAVGAATSTVVGGTIGYGMGLFEGNAEVGLRRLAGEGARHLVANRGVDGLRVGAAGLGVLGLTAGLSGVRANRLTRYLATGISGAAGAVIISAVTGYVGAAVASLICAASSRALGYDAYPLANQAWDAGAVTGALVGALLGGGAGGRAFWPG